jgi:hypothetical protein
MTGEDVQAVTGTVGRSEPSVEVSEPSLRSFATYTTYRYSAGPLM